MLDKITADWLCAGSFTLRAEPRGETLSRELRFESDGHISGYTHPNETFWTLHDGELQILSADRFVTCNMIVHELEDGRFFFSGDWVDPNWPETNTQTIHYVIENRRSSISDEISFDVLVPKITGSNFRNPKILSVSELPINNMLLIGSCTAQELPDIMGVECDYIVYNGGILPIIPQNKHYDIQVWQIPMRLLLDSPSLSHIGFNDVFAYEKQLRAAIIKLRAVFDSFSRLYGSQSCPVFVYNFLMPTLNPMGRLQRSKNLANPKSFIGALNAELEVLCEDQKNTYIINIDEIANTMGKRYFFDEYMDWYSHNSVHLLQNNAALGRNDGLTGARLESSPSIVEHFAIRDPREFHDAVAAEIRAMYRAYHGVDSVKMIVVDLDDTLWKGVIGDKEDEIKYSHPNMKGKLAPMAEGWPRGFAEALTYLKRRGIIIAIISRNDEKVITERFDDVFEGEITLDDFSVKFINFRDKVENMKDLLSQVNLLPEHVIFIDDNPVERSKMSNAFGDMRVLGRYFLWHRHLLLNASETQVRVITAEAENRTKWVAGQVEREVSRSAMTDEKFLESIELSLHCRKITKSSSGEGVDRCIELINKTNQWNSTGQKIENDRIATFLEGDGTIYAFSASDRFTSYGEICFVLVLGSEVTQLVMSCRVAGLHVESAVLRYVLNDRQPNSLTMVFVKTPKNSPFRLFAERFASDGSTIQLDPGKLDGTEHVSFI